MEMIEVNYLYRDLNGISHSIIDKVPSTDLETLYWTAWLHLTTRPSFLLERIVVVATGDIVFNWQEVPHANE
ncbi:MAG TPA: hypothetical protein VHI13_16695 [Candidatus Kapabacteria bacterium]|nr:hypothetical protein [Candidatus Kapabacteria bacterium]